MVPLPLQLAPQIWHAFSPSQVLDPVAAISPAFLNRGAKSLPSPSIPSLLFSFDVETSTFGVLSASGTEAVLGDRSCRRVHGCTHRCRACQGFDLTLVPRGFWSLMS